MRALSLMLVAVVGLMVLGRSVPARAATQDELGPPLLSSGDVPAGFTEFQRGQIDQVTEQGIPHAFVLYTRLPSLRTPSIGAVGVLLADAASADAANVTPEQLIGNLSETGVSVTPISAPAIGRETLAYHISETITGITLSGDCITWRQSGVLAVVCGLGEGTNAVTLAQTQQMRLLYAFPE